MAQASDGTMYIGNGYGVLEYDGYNWNLIPLPSRTLVRSLDVGPGDTLYTGGVRDLGFIAKGANGQSRFYSLKEQLPEQAQSFAQVRATKVINGKVFYLDFKTLMVWDIAKKSFEVYTPSFSFGNLMQVGDRLFISEITENIHSYNFDTGQLEDLPGTQTLAREYPKSMISHSGGYLISTDKNVYFYTEAGSSLQPFELSPSPATFDYAYLFRLPDGSIGLQTSDSGLAIYNNDGQLELMLDETNGLANNNLHHHFIDKEGALWVTHNQGINRVNLHMPFRMFDSRMKLFDIVNDVLRVDHRIFVSTHSGTFSFDERQAGFEFTPVLESNVESFALEKIGGWVLVSTTPGLFAVNPRTLESRMIFRGQAYKFEQSERDPSVIVYGDQQGVMVFRFDGKDGFTPVDYTGKVPYHIRFVDQDDKGVFWIGTIDNKLVLLDFFEDGTLDQPKVSVFDQTHGVPVSQISPRLVKGTMYLNSQDGVFELVDGKIVRSPAFDEVNTMVPYMEYDQEGNVYLLAGYPPSMRIRKFVPKGADYVEVNAPELSFIESTGLWISTPDFDGSYWISSTDGVLHYNPNSYRPSGSQLSTQISSVTFGDSTIIRHVTEPPILTAGLHLPSFNYGNQSIRFEFSLPTFNSEEKTVFRYKLDGFDNDWSAWTTTHFKEYAGLREGRYTFRVESKGLLGVSGREASYSFVIKPPWYRSVWFMVAAGLLFAGGGAYTVRYFSTIKLKRRVEELELQQKIQKERERISSDLHDHVGAQLTSIIAGLQITEQIEDFQFNPRVRQIIDSLKEDASQTMTNLRDSIWSLHHEDVKMGIFAEHLDAYITGKLRYFPGIHFNSSIIGDKSKILTPTLSLHLLRAVQEAFQNILKHAAATQVTLLVADRKSHLEITLSDDGKGFTNGSQDGEHYGLDNMRRRMEEVGGAAEISSQPGNGTTVKFTVPFA